MFNTLNFRSRGKQLEVCFPESPDVSRDESLGELTDFPKYLTLRVCFFEMIRIRISDPRALGSWYIKWTYEFTGQGFIGSFDLPWSCDLRSMILIRIIWKERSGSPITKCRSSNPRPRLRRGLASRPKVVSCAFRSTYYVSNSETDIVYITATSLFNSFCSNVAKQVARFLSPVFPYLYCSNVKERNLFTKSFCSIS